MKAFTLILLVMGLGIGNASAAIKCWKNAEGVRECGNAIPPEYSQKRTETLNQKGQTVEVESRAKTKEELDAEADAKRIAEEKAEIEKQMAEEQAKKDKVLLSTYTKLSEIEASRDRNLEAIDGAINVEQILLNKLKNKLEARSAALNKANPNDSIIKDISDLKKQVDQKQAFIATKQNEREHLVSQYEADIKRFKELKGIK